VLEATNENVLLLPITLDRDNRGAHAACWHFSDLGAGFELEVLVKLEVESLLNERLVLEIKS